MSTIRQKHKAVSVERIITIATNSVEAIKVNKHTQITEDISIMFAEWITTCGYSIEGGLWFDYSPLPMTDIGSGITTKELFEIFKKEKEL